MWQFLYVLLFLLVNFSTEYLLAYDWISCKVRIVAASNPSILVLPLNLILAILVNL